MLDIRHELRKRCVTEGSNPLQVYSAALQQMPELVEAVMVQGTIRQETLLKDLRMVKQQQRCEYLGNGYGHCKSAGSFN